MLASAKFARFGSSFSRYIVISAMQGPSGPSCEDVVATVPVDEAPHDLARPRSDETNTQIPKGIAIPLTLGGRLIC